MPSGISVSFAGCGFLAPFHLGAVAALSLHGLTIKQALGSSSGSVVAAAVILGVPDDVRRRSFRRLLRRALKLQGGPLHPRFDVADMWNRDLGRMIPPDAHVRCSGKLTVSITAANGARNELINKFSSRQDLIDCLVCSSFLPAYSGYSFPKFRGKIYLDGGLSNNQPVLDSNTVRINPLASDGDITPKDENVSKSFLKAGVRLDLSPANAERLYRAFWPYRGMDGHFYDQGFTIAESYIRSKQLSCDGG